MFANYVKPFSFALPLLLVLVALGWAATRGEATAADKASGNCCEKKMACCTEGAACCAATAKLGCCEKGMACCQTQKGCCSSPQKCCVEGQACCEASKACCGDKSVKKVASCCQADKDATSVD